VPRLVRWLYERVGDHGAQLLFIGGHQCSASSFRASPWSTALAGASACRRCRRYLGESPYMNAMTTGASR
jgi:hypothetical protein